MLSHERDQAISRFKIEQTKAECLAKEKQSLLAEKDQLKMEGQEWKDKFCLVGEGFKSKLLIILQNFFEFSFSFSLFIVY